ncbi:hypothetical protein NLG97_g5704 [Lecanicillium saksenae]|uniref:Uncharacterized protein n=1 Tax=Lecanicillium saksenae TaxID=468837 RepID=A0ACC1QUA0_9HYPO|nr:hypothetical protein NLG97_g5704 [Lecanicillium saksenae]
MGSVIQIGDAIKFMEMAKKLYDYGWAPENNAGESYRAFLKEVEILYYGLQQIDTAFQNARDTLVQNGAQRTTLLRADQYSLSEIIGDYESTIHEGQELLRNNQRYNQATGPLRNILWNTGAMRQVEHLRGRIHMHNLKIQHVLTPFKMDLISNMHQDLANRVMGVDTIVREIRDNLGRIIPALAPEAVGSTQQSSSQQPQSFNIPAPIQSRLDNMFARARGPSMARMSLQQLVECFYAHFEKINGSSQANLENHNRTPPRNRSLELLKCQFLLQKINASPEKRRAPEISHWHTYIRYLEEKLSTERSRYNTEPNVEEIMNCDDEVFMFHFPLDAPPRKDFSIQSPSYDFLMHLSLDMGPNSDGVKSIRLLRRTASESQFRIIESWGNMGETPRVEPKVIDFNIRKARLLPVYAFPVQEGESAPPLQIILEENGHTHYYTFSTKGELWDFQAALTGYKVVYMESHAKVDFVREKRATVNELATIQIWKPYHINGQPMVQGRERYLSVDSAVTSVTGTGRSSRTSSIGSRLSDVTASGSSWSSVSQVSTRAVHLDNGPANTSHAIIRSAPSNPLLVFFTLSSFEEYASSGLVSIKVSDDIASTWKYCKCRTDTACREAVIEKHSGGQTFKSQRLNDMYDLFHLAHAKEWAGLLRLELTFATAHARQRFSGGPCKCTRRTGEEEKQCLLEKKHEGQLGAMGVFHTLKMKEWRKEQEKLLVSTTNLAHCCLDLLLLFLPSTLSTMPGSSRRLAIQDATIVLAQARYATTAAAYYLAGRLFLRAEAAADAALEALLRGFGEFRG